MKKYIYITLIFASSVYAILPAKATTEFSAQLQQVDTLKKDGVDPVCKMKVKAGATKTHVYNKVTYGFCSDGCKKRFIKQPEQYLKK